MNTALGRQYSQSVSLKFSTLDRPLSDIADIPEETRRRLELVTGHVHYGVHDFLPAPCRYITILRDPVARVLSLYKYILREPRHPLHRTVTAGVTLEEYASTDMDQNQVENGQTRQIAGLQTGDPDEQHLETAKKNLEGFAVVGVTEKFDESLILMRQTLGWKNVPYYASRNVPRRGRAQTSPSPAAIAAIRHRNQLDLQLYELAGELFLQQVKNYPGAFDEEVARFQRLNRVPNTVGTKINTLKGLVWDSKLWLRLRSYIK